MSSKSSVSSSPVEVSSLGFYGCVVSSSSPVTLVPAPDRVLRLSSACLPANAPEKARVTLLVADPNSKSEFALASLTHHSPHTSLDLFFVANQSAAFKVIGNSEIHLTGYTTVHEIYEGEEYEEEGEDFEDEDDDGDYFDEMGSDQEEDEDDEEDQGSQEDDEDQEEDEDEEEDENDAMDGSSLSSDPREIIDDPRKAEKVRQLLKNKVKVIESESESDSQEELQTKKNDQKRKADDAQAKTAQTPAKKAKVSEAATPASASAAVSASKGFQCPHCPKLLGSEDARNQHIKGKHEAGQNTPKPQTPAAGAKAGNQSAKKPENKNEKSKAK